MTGNARPRLSTDVGEEQAVHEQESPSILQNHRASFTIPVSKHLIFFVKVIGGLWDVPFVHRRVKDDLDATVHIPRMKTPPADPRLHAAVKT
eukprot:5428702-Amphidinium_carterae.1